jgi:hypothetical protein
VAALLRSRSRRRRSGRCPAGVAGGVGRAAALLRHRVPNSTSTRGSATDTVTSHGDDDPSLVPLLREQIAALDARVARIERQERRVRRFRAWLLEWLHPSAPPPPQLQRRHPRRRCGGWPCTHRVAHVQVPLERLPELEVRRQLLRRRNRDFFADSLSRIVELISVEEGSLPVGSFKYLAMTYPGDIDM